MKFLCLTFGLLSVVTLSSSQYSYVYEIRHDGREPKSEKFGDLSKYKYVTPSELQPSPAAFAPQPPQDRGYTEAHLQNDDRVNPYLVPQYRKLDDNELNQRQFVVRSPESGPTMLNQIQQQLDNKQIRHDTQLWQIVPNQSPNSLIYPEGPNVPLYSPQPTPQPYIVESKQPEYRAAYGFQPEIPSAPPSATRYPILGQSRSHYVPIEVSNGYAIELKPENGAHSSQPQLIRLRPQPSHSLPPQQNLRSAPRITSELAPPSLHSILPQPQYQNFPQPQHQIIPQQHYQTGPQLQVLTQPPPQHQLEPLPQPQPLLYSSPNQNEYNSYDINSNEPISLPVIPIQGFSQPPKPFIQSEAAAKLYQRLNSKSSQILANPQTYRLSQSQPVQDQPYDVRYIDI
jgi:hypothetical protein